MNSKNPGEGLRIIWSGITEAFTGTMVFLGYLVLAAIGLTLILATAGLYWLLSGGKAEEYIKKAQEAEDWQSKREDYLAGKCPVKGCDNWNCNEKHYA